MMRLFNAWSRRRPNSSARKPRSRLQFESLERRDLMAADFHSASLIDASGDVTPATAFQDGALRISYDLTLSQREMLESIRIVAGSGRDSVELKAAQKLMPSGGWPTAESDVLFDLKDHPELPAGNYQMRIVAETSSGDVSFSDPFPMRVLDTTQIDGTFRGEWLDLTGELAANHAGIVVHGQGGADTMYLNSAMSQIESINGQSLEQFDPLATDDLPIHQGYIVDHIVLENGSEIYFTGVERLGGTSADPFSPAPVVKLFVQPNDPEFANQWNLHVSDVPSAWRFTTGSENVLLVSLDTGVLPPDPPEDVSTDTPDAVYVDSDPTGQAQGMEDVSTDTPVSVAEVTALEGAQAIREHVSTDTLEERLYGRIADLTEGRLITDETDDENLHFTNGKFGHGHMAVSVMSSTPNNGEFVAGINWTSDVFVADVYDADVDLQSAIEEALAYAEQKNQKIVFQGGVQGESWLTDGGTQAQLESLFSANENRAVFAVAAGNGGVEVDDIPGPNQNRAKSGGVARLQTTHENVMAIGALQHDAEIVDGVANAEDVYKAEYSNYGRALTLMGATDAPATYLFSDIEEPQFEQPNGTREFGGTSGANPNVAGIASLAWSVNLDLSGADIREILTDTAMSDLPKGGGVETSSGKDFHYGHGLANADLAVRRALELAADEHLVNIDHDPRADLKTLEKPRLASGDPALPLASIRSATTITQLRLAPENTETRQDGDVRLRSYDDRMVAKKTVPTEFSRPAQTQRTAATFAESLKTRAEH
ncbi:MAG: S8 family serine peptidase, partial [Planctomycetes bacterium]|nr:S8 family serine peptidase [Planctomycetota bacterium]